MRYRILGSTLVDGEPVGPRQVRTVLATLVSHANQPVTSEALAGELWSGRRPDSSAAVLQGRISTLRKLLSPDLPARSPEQVLHTRHSCYTLDIAEGELDAAEFLRRTEAGERAAARGAFADAREELGAALDLWRGRALQDTGRGPILSSYAGMLEQRRLVALERFYEADIELGEFSEAISGLTEQLGAARDQENFAALLIEALRRSGRGGQAREVFDDTVDALASAGVSPGDRLRQAGAQLRVSPPAPDDRAPDSCPAQMPPQLPDFTGRGELLERIRAELTGRGPRPVVLTGPGGVGKSTLAVHAAHLQRREFGDGQVVAELADEPGSPVEVLRRFLLAIGVREHDIPHGLVERQQLWRTRTADSAVLVVLDGARDEAQVRALLPTGNRCGVLVTSRRRMLGLAGATTIAVDAFSTTEAEQLLAAIVGPDRVLAEPAATTKLLAQCAGLPLAVRIAGAKLAARPHEKISELAGRIRAGRSRLAELRAGDLDVHATIELSYTECTEIAQRALRLLGEVRLPAITRDAVASLLDVPGETGSEVAESLVDAQLLSVDRRDALGVVRYQLHDLIAEFARDKAAHDPAELDTGLSRLLEHYLRITDSGPMAVDTALWCTTEAGNVLAVLRAALHRKWWDRAWRLADSFAELATVCPGSAEARNITVLAVWAATRGEDPRAEALSLRRLGELHWQQLKERSAARYLTAAADRFHRMNDPREFARTLVTYADVLVESGQANTARERLREAITVAEDAGDHRVHATALDELAGIHADSGEHADAEARFVEALQLCHAAGDERTTAVVRKRRADLLHRLGCTNEATGLLEQSLAGARRTGDRHWEAHALRSLGEVQRFAGDIATARANLHRSVELFTEHGHRHAAGYSVRCLADLHAQVHEYDAAAAALEHCKELFEQLRDRRGQAHTLRSFGALYVRTGRWAEAERALSAAAKIFGELSMLWFQREVLRALEQTRRWSRAATANPVVNPASGDPTIRQTPAGARPSGS